MDFPRKKRKKNRFAAEKPHGKWISRGKNARKIYFPRKNRTENGVERASPVSVGLKVEVDVDGGLQILDALHGQLEVVLGHGGLGLGQLQLLLQLALLGVGLRLLLLRRGVVLAEFTEL
jgi:hypothetical protein